MGWQWSRAVGLDNLPHSGADIYLNWHNEEFKTLANQAVVQAITLEQLAEEVSYLTKAFIAARSGHVLACVYAHGALEMFSRP
eukprot:6456792-Amphidinium_carterae.1